MFCNFQAIYPGHISSSICRGCFKSNNSVFHIQCQSKSHGQVQVHGLRMYILFMRCRTGANTADHNDHLDDLIHTRETGAFPQDWTLPRMCGYQYVHTQLQSAPVLLPALLLICVPCHHPSIHFFSLSSSILGPEKKWDW